MKLKQSPFLHIIPMDQKWVVFYNSLNLEIAFLNKSFLKQHQRGEMFVALDATSKRVLASLQKLGLLIEEQSDGYKLYKAYQKTLNKPAINILYLLLSDDCNLRCRYCYFFISYVPELPILFDEGRNDD